MERHKIIDKIWDIQTANEDKFMGRNEADLYTREEVADLIEELLLEASESKNDINTPEPQLKQADVISSLPFRKCDDCGSEYYSNERCPECSPMG